MKARFVVLCLAGLLALPEQAWTQDEEQDKHRRPKFAGSFYPATEKQLLADLDAYFKQAKAIGTEGKVRTLIVPHAGYDYSAVVAASGYKSIPKETKYDNIFIITSSHKEQFEGASVYSAGNYLTPLGEAKVNRELARQLISSHTHIRFLPGAHEEEHGIEVQVPFIQYHFKDTPPIVPLVMGSSSLAAARDLAAALLPWFTPDNLFIISSDFSQYPSYKDAQSIDRLTGEAILTKNPESFYAALRKVSAQGTSKLVTPTFGWSSIMTMLYMADRREEIEMTPVLYRNSGDVSVGDKERVVGYWAIAGHEIAPENTAFTLDQEDQQKLLAISRLTLETYLNSGTLAEIDPGQLSKSLRQPAAAFVSFFMGGRLRGRTGVFAPDKPLYLVVQELTLATALNDQGFARVEASELPYISIELSVLSPMQPITSIEEIRLGKHGIFMSKGDKSGTLLPQDAISQGWNVEEFLGHCAREIAGMGYEEWKEADLYVYEAIIFGEVTQDP